jgi:hypothetical protein
MGVRIKKNPNIKWIEGKDEKLLKNKKRMNLIMTLEI